MRHGRGRARVDDHRYLRIDHEVARVRRGRAPDVARVGCGGRREVEVEDDLVGGAVVERRRLAHLARHALDLARLAGEALGRVDAVVGDAHVRAIADLAVLALGRRRAPAAAGAGDAFLVGGAVGLAVDGARVIAAVRREVAQAIVGAIGVRVAVRHHALAAHARLARAALAIHAAPVRARRQRRQAEAADRILGRRDRRLAEAHRRPTDRRPRRRAVADRRTLRRRRRREPAPAEDRDLEHAQLLPEAWSLKPEAALHLNLTVALAPIE